MHINKKSSLTLSIWIVSTWILSITVFSIYAFYSANPSKDCVEVHRLENETMFSNKCTTGLSLIYHEIGDPKCAPTESKNYPCSIHFIPEMGNKTIQRTAQQTLNDTKNYDWKYCPSESLWDLIAHESSWNTLECRKTRTQYETMRDHYYSRYKQS